IWQNPSNQVPPSFFMDVSLEQVQTSEQWEAYHALRRTILFERRAQFGVYDANHPDDRRDNHHPMVLRYGDQYVGVIRIDLDTESETAYFRRVAIAEDLQRKGFGAHLMRLAEEFAASKGFSRFAASVAKDAIPFYQKLGYHFADEENYQKQDDPLMIKGLSGN
ncbi:MAG: GNAT family N-acetyltransferase, partial [Bdellovibrionota bacterium]